MKFINYGLKAIVFHLIMLHSSLLCQPKKFIREYTYIASESDSKLSSRKKAINQVQVLLLGEIGQYIESWVNLKTEENNERIGDFFRKEINTITAGITETKIINEKWDGYTYYIRAEITLDTDDVLKRINQSIEKQINSKEIIRLRNLLTKTTNINKSNIAEIKILNNKLKTEKLKHHEKEKELNALKRELKSTKSTIVQIESNTRLIRSEVEKIKIKIKNLTESTLVNIKLGMIPSEVLKVNGKPRSKDNCLDALFWNYGKVWVFFHSGVVASVFESRKFGGPCKSTKYYYSINLISN